jgi:CheY-like chemotaxis protein
VQQTIDRSQGGLGIGLTLARTLAEMHGGTLNASSGGLGQGSEFVLRLPLVEATTSEVTNPAIAASPAARSAPRVLVVDDNVDSARGLEHLLVILGYDVRTVFDGRAALEAAQSHQPAVVLLDIGLPGMDGYEVAGRIRGDQRLRDALLIAVTGYGQDEDRRRSYEAGFDHHLIKPIDFDALVALLEQPEEAASPSHGQERR